MTDALFVDQISFTQRYPLLYRVRLGDRTLYTSIEEKKANNILAGLQKYSVTTREKFLALPWAIKVRLLSEGISSVDFV